MGVRRHHLFEGLRPTSRAGWLHDAGAALRPPGGWRLPTPAGGRSSRMVRRAGSVGPLPAWKRPAGTWSLAVLLALQAAAPQVRRRLKQRKRRAAIRALERARGTRVITMIHRQEMVSLLGLPLRRFIDIEDAEQILRAIRATPPEQPIDLIIHTPGGLVLASDQIAAALKRHPGRVTVIVPHYAMSGGTLVALAADEILMDPDAVLGPVDPQLGSFRSGFYPAPSILKALEQENPNRDDDTLILGDIAAKAVSQVRDTVRGLLAGRMPDAEAARIAAVLSEGRWTHDYPISLERAKEIGLPASDAVPAAVYDLMELYPRPPQRRPTVEFVPAPRRRSGGR